MDLTSEKKEFADSVAWCLTIFEVLYEHREVTGNNLHKMVIEKR